MVWLARGDKLQRNNSAMLMRSTFRRTKGYLMTVPTEWLLINCSRVWPKD
jgi:hypothetical protein